MGTWAGPVEEQGSAFHHSRLSLTPGTFRKRFGARKASSCIQLCIYGATFRQGYLEARLKLSN